MRAKPDEMIDNTTHLWGLDPKPDEHAATIGWRAIGYCGGPLDYLWDRSCARGMSSDIDRLLHWWKKKRTGAEARFHKSDTPNDTVWRLEEGDFSAAARPAYGYVYITLYYK